MAMMMMDGAFPLSQALASLQMSQTLVNSLVAVDWMSFGKMDSHLYRKQLYERFQSTNLTGEQRFMIYFLFSAVKNQKRVLMGLDSMPDSLKASTWFSNVRSFVDSNLCQYVSQVTKQKKFPAVNIPVTNPGLDLLCWAIWVPPRYLNVTNMFERPNSSQLALDEMAQSKAKVGYKKYWDEVVNGTKNPDAKDLDLPKPMMREEYYQNAANDKYPLIRVDMKPVPIPEKGYSETGILSWMFSVKLQLKLGKVAFTKDNTYFMTSYNTAPESIRNFSFFTESLDEALKEVSRNKALRMVTEASIPTAALAQTMTTPTPAPPIPSIPFTPIPTVASSSKAAMATPPTTTMAASVRERSQSRGRSSARAATPTRVASKSASGRVRTQSSMNREKAGKRSIGGILRSGSKSRT